MFTKQLLVFSVLFALVYSADCPGGIRVRKEFRDLTKEEFASFKHALTILRETNDPKTGLSQYDKWPLTHIEAAVTAHSTPQFFPWHRLFVYHFENELRKIDPSITIPYWDWSFDAREPLLSPIFTKDYLLTKIGTDGDCQYPCQYPNPHCLIRNYDPDDFTSFVDSRSLHRLMMTSGTDYDRFRRLLEATPHAIVHVSIGGTEGDLTEMQSPNDPIFWLHHSFIDKIWHDWQILSGTPNAYNGQHLGRDVSPEDILEPYNVAVADTFNITDYCYRYEPFSKRTQPDGLEAPVPLENEKGALFKLPRKLPETWAKMNNITVEELRKIELEIHSIIMEANNQTLRAETPLEDHQSSANSMAPLLLLLVATILFCI